MPHSYSTSKNSPNQINQKKHGEGAVFVLHSLYLILIIFIPKYNEIILLSLYEGVCCLVEFRIFPLREAELLGGLVCHHAGDGEGGGGARRRGVAAVQHSRSEAGLEDEVPHEVALQVHGLANEQS